MNEYILDIFFILGLLLLIVPTFIINVVAGCYFLGLIFFLFAIFANVRKTPED